MAQTSLFGTILGSFTFSCTIRGFGPKSKYRPCVTAIPHEIQQVLWDGQQKWQQVSQSVEKSNPFDKRKQSRNIIDEKIRVTLPNHTVANVRAEPPMDTSVSPDSLDLTTGTLNNFLTKNALPITNSENHQQVKWSQRHAPTQRLRESIEQGLYGLQCNFYDYEGHEEYLIQRELLQPLAFAANKSDPDTMYMHQVMWQPDKEQFKQAMLDEINAHTENKHCKIIERREVPEGVKVLPSVWAMKRKRRISTGKIYKWKARLNLHGGKQEHGINYWETYAALLAWPTIQFMLTQAIIMGWKTRQIDFTLAYPQAEAECQLYMDIPKGFKVEGGNEFHCLKILKNIYWQRQAGCIWSLHLKKGLQECGFTQSTVDKCVFYKEQVIFMAYVDDAVLTSPQTMHILQFTAGSLQKFQSYRWRRHGWLLGYQGGEAVKRSHIIDSTTFDCKHLEGHQLYRKHQKQKHPSGIHTFAAVRCRWQGI